MTTLARASSPSLPRESERIGFLTRMTEQPFDLAVIGGGSTGAGIASAAARRGLRVALIERDDFAAGTSSRSSKLIHGGLRYLQSFEFRLVSRSARERQEIHQLAPHLAEPRWMLAPHKGRLTRATLRTGIAFYEWLGRVSDSDRQQFWNRAAMEREEPLLRSDRYPQAIAYREYSTDDARLVLALLRDAVRHDAMVINHCALQQLRPPESGDTHFHLHCEDRFGGDTHLLRARSVVNATGPWADEILGKQQNRVAPLLTLSRGIHLVVPAERLPVNHLIMLRAIDQRRFFVMRRGAVVHIGTTETPCSNTPEYWPEVSEDEVDYLLRSASAHFQGPGLTREDIVGAWAGLRPLVNPGGGTNLGKVSRSDELLQRSDGLITIAGGKLTGFPGMARRVLEAVDAQQGRARQVPDGRAQASPLPGGELNRSVETHAEELRQRFPHLKKSQSIRLIRYYGSEADEVLSLGEQPFEELPDIFTGELVWGLEREGALHISDLLQRRLRLFYYFAHQNLSDHAVLSALTCKVAELQGWDSVRTSRELERLKNFVAREWPSETLEAAKPNPRLRPSA